MTVSTDQQLWERAVQGDARAFGEIYERHDRAVLAYCLWRTGDGASAEDLAQIVFLEAWRRRDRTPLTTPSARPLLLGIAHNVVRGQWRARRRHRAALERLATAVAPRPGHDDAAVDRLAAHEQLGALRERLDALPQREREVLALTALADLSYEETAAALGLPVGTVRSRLSRARTRLAGDSVPADPLAVDPSPPGGAVTAPSSAAPTPSEVIR